MKKKDNVNSVCNVQCPLWLVCENWGRSVSHYEPTYHAHGFLCEQCGRLELISPYPSINKEAYFPHFKDEFAKKFPCYYLLEKDKKHHGVICAVCSIKTWRKNNDC